DLPVCGGGEDYVELQFLEVGAPEGEAVVVEHGARDAHARPRTSGGQQNFFQQLVTVVEQILEDGLAVGTRPLAKLVGALVPPVGAFSLDGELFHVAVIRARTANKVPCGELHPVEVVAPETAGAAGVLHAVARDERHADGPDHAVMRRDNNPLAQDLGEGGRHGVVVSGSPLEEDDVADLPSPHHAVQVVQGHGISQARGEIPYLRALQQQPRDVALHEDRATFTQPRGIGGGQGQAREFLLDGNPQLLGLLFQERAGAGGAGFVHGEVHHHALLNADELRVLPADFEDRIHRLHAHLLADVHGPGLVGGDLVVDRVGAHQFADQLAAGTRGPHATNVEPGPEFGLDLLEPPVNHLDGPPLRGQVDFFQKIACYIGNHQVGAHRADIDSEVRFDLI